MFRKITSNRDPKTTIGSELRREFSGWFNKLSRSLEKLLRSYPRASFGGMIALMLISGVLAFTVMRSQPEPALPPAQYPALSGTGGLMNTIAALQDIWMLRRNTDSLLKKDTLTSADSVRLQSANEQMEHILQQLKVSQGTPKGKP